MKNTTLVYADINCPFCFALHERLATLGLLEQVAWQAIEHAPAASANDNDPRLNELLNNEYKLVLQRAPDLIIHNPQFTPNTALINAVLYQLGNILPDQLIAFRTRVYRALWHEGKDISNPDVIRSLLHEFQLTDILGDFETLTHNNYWQELWLNGDFDMRIPAMAHTHNDDVMLGLQNPLTIRQFIEYKTVDYFDQSNVCKYKSKDKIAIFCANQHRSQLNEMLASCHFELHFFDKIAQLKHTLQQNDIELLLIDSTLDEKFSLCRNLNFEMPVEIPIIYFSFTSIIDVEANAFMMGASDLIDLSRQRMALCERIKVHVRNKKKLDILTAHASLDALTGLYNRREIDNYLERSWRNACRYQNQVAVFMIDIDHFKAYNDSYGHPKGDEALLLVANVLSGGRSEDLVGRIGGEEFIIIINDSANIDLESIANRIHKSLSHQAIEHNESDTASYLTVSIGVSSTHAHADNNYRMLLEEADQALYQAKKNGRNRTEFRELATPKYKQ